MPSPGLRGAIDAVPARGYRWWYVDGLSDDGRRGFTAIFLVGSSFSPWLLRRVRRGEDAAPREHLGVHLALYEEGREVGWAMSHYPGSALDASADELRIGGSRLSVDEDGTLRAEFAERSAPAFFSRLGLGRALKGRMTLHPTGGAAPDAIELGPPGGARHLWHVRAPSARIEVEFDAPGFAFVGRGYHDTNWGEGRLEETFRRWSWSRFHDARGTRILYAVEPREGAPRGVVIDASDDRVEVRADRPAGFAPTTPIGWGLSAPASFTIEDPLAGEARVARWLDRTPFYARYVARLGEVDGVGEYLDLDRFTDPGVQFLLRWKGQRR